MPRRGTDSHNMRHGKRSKNMHQMIPHMMPSMMSHPGGMMFPHMMPSMLPPGPESDSESEANEVPASNPASHAASTSAAPSNGSNVAAAVEPPPPPSHGPELSDAMRQKISRSLVCAPTATLVPTGSCRIPEQQLRLHVGRGSHAAWAAGPAVLVLSHKAQCSDQRIA